MQFDGLLRYSVMESYVNVMFNGRLNLVSFTHIWDYAEDKCIEADPYMLGLFKNKLITKELLNEVFFKKPLDSDLYVVVQYDSYLMATMNRLNNEYQLYLNQIEEFTG